MTRARAVALLVTGCVLAALAAGTGAFLSAHETAPLSLRQQLRNRIALVRNRPVGGVPHGFAHALDVVLGVLAFALAAAVLLWGLWRLGKAIAALARLRFAPSRGGTGTSAYESDETGDDAETVLRRRVREEIVALSADLDTAPDAREVVIACYARMESALAEAGSPRHATESPFELLRRVLAEQHVPEGDVHRLTALFSEARFSRHPITDDMRDAARTSLRSVADSLAVPL